MRGRAAVGWVSGDAVSWGGWQRGLGLRGGGRVVEGRAWRKVGGAERGGGNEQARERAMQACERGEAFFRKAACEPIQTLVAPRGPRPRVRNG